MNKLTHFWKYLTEPQSQDSDDAQQEYLTKAILLIQGITLGIFTLPIIVGWILGEFSSDTILIMLSMLITTLIANRLAHRGQWYIAGHVPTMMLFAVGVYFSFIIPLGLTPIFFIVLTILLAGILQGIREQWLILTLCVFSYFWIGTWRSQETVFSVITLVITMSGTFSGMIFLQWFVINQYQESIKKARIFQEEVTRANETLQAEIVERKQAEDALLLTQFSMDSLEDAVFWMGSDAKIVYVNNAAMNVLGYNQIELLSMTVHDFDPNFPREVWPEHWKEIQEKKSFTLQTIHQRKDGSTFPVEVSVNLIQFGEKEINCAIARDVTDRIKAETALKQYAEHLEEMVEERTSELMETQNQLFRNERLVLLGKLAGGLGHELRNPLGVLSNAVYYLKMVVTDPDENIKEYLDIISSEVQNAEKIVSDLLDFAREKIPEREEVVISKLISRVLAKHCPPENVIVTTNIVPDMPLLFIDPRQVSQVLQNLFTNAYQAMPEGGQLIVGSTWDGDFARIIITDTGFGITPENLKKLFEPLFSTKPRGIGLGLAISQTLVEKNGGSIEVQSVEGEGSSFSVRLPTVEDGKDLR